MIWERDKPLRSFDGQFLIMGRVLEGWKKNLAWVKKMSFLWRRGGDNVPVHSFLALSTIWSLFLHNYPQRGRSNRNAKSEKLVASLSLKCLLVCLLVKYSAWCKWMCNYNSQLYRLSTELYWKCRWALRILFWIGNYSSPWRSREWPLLISCGDVGWVDGWVRETWQTAMICGWYEPYQPLLYCDIVVFWLT